MLRRTVRLTAALGVIGALGLWPTLGWQTAALFAVGAAISVASIFEWARLIRTVTERMDRYLGTNQPSAQAAGAETQPSSGAGPRSGSGRGSGLGSGLVIVLFLFRLMIAGLAIYGSLKCFHGSPIALLCGLGLALAGLVWESMKILRG
jgi:hypothetical protein